MFSENRSNQEQSFFKGANRDTAPDKVFGNANSGFYIDGHNVQPISNDNKTGNIERIKGEELLYPNEDNLSGYFNMAAFTVNGHIVELWAPPETSDPSIIRIDGVVVLSSTLLDLRYGYPLWWDVYNSSEVSEFTISDKRVPPYVFNVDDLLSSVGAPKYFSAFEPKLYQVNIQSALDIPVFIEMINVGGGGGLPVGHYQYQMRYVTKEGDATNWSHPTPMIPVMQSLSTESLQYPWVKTFGGPPKPESVTSFAPRLRFRVTNLYNYDYIEIKRIEYNRGAGLQYTPNGYVVARIDISAGEISVREYIDPQQSNINIAISANDESRVLAHIESAGPVKYYDRRLVFSDVTLASKEADLQFEEINEKQGFPVIDKIYKEGYNDPWNHVHRKSETRGEKVGYGVALYDCVGNKGWVSKIPDLKNYTFPNRRDPVSAETLNYSYNGVCRAANTVPTTTVGPCHEVFDLEDAVSKNDYCSFKNIIESGRFTGLSGTKTTANPYGVNWDCQETNAQIENHGTRVSGIVVSSSYQPFTPVNQNDPDTRGHNYVVNTKVGCSEQTVGGPIVAENEDAEIYRPKGMGPNYYAMGMMVSGISNFPDWTKAFSIVRTPSAGRVFSQGLAYYSLIPGEFKLLLDNNLAGKSLNKFWLFMPDVENGIVSSDSVNDLIDNPQNYAVQFVSPLGFFSEWYSAEDKTNIVNFANSERDRCIDMISYVRMISDVTGPDGALINPAEDPAMGFSGGDGKKYVGYDRYRNSSNVPTTFSGSADGGNKTFNVTSVNRKAEGRGTYFELEVSGDVYATMFAGGHADSSFEDEGMRNWTEPIYVVNIIRTGANVPDNDLQKYMQTTHYQKLESIIGKSTGVAGQVFPLVDERWEDCISAPTSSSYGASTNRYVYIKLTDGTVEKWVNVTYKTVVQRASIIADIQAGIGDIKGVYTHTSIQNGRFYELNFDISGYTPPSESLIMVRYDKTAPIRVYGGDSYIGEAIFAPIDRQASARDDAAETQFAMGIGLPYKDFKINPRYYTIRKVPVGSVTFPNTIQDKEWFSIGFLRQLCVMFTAETRGGIHLSYNLDHPNQFFPLINYVIRPNRWDVEKNYADNAIFDDYPVDYGDSEKDIWKWGGFRFLQQWNADYSVMPPLNFFSQPQIGFEENRRYITGTMWSLPAPINVKNAPGRKTFPANNLFIIDDNQGAIKWLFIDTAGSGENIYAVTEKGICMLLTKKSILSDLGANQLGYIAADLFIGGQYWITRDIGIPDYMFRSVCETYVPTKNGSTARALFFANYLSVYRFMGNQVVDISNDYHTKLEKFGLETIQEGLDTIICSGYDLHKDQFYLHIYNEDNEFYTFVYGQVNDQWFGTNSFIFNRFLSFNGESYGFRSLETYKLNVGNEINGSPIEATVTGAFAPEASSDKEFIRIRINSGEKPAEVEFYKELDGAVQCSISPALGPLYLKNYRGWEGYIPRIDSAVNPNRPRLQERLIIYKIIFNLADSLSLSNVVVEYKKIKT